jgi:uncharacterized protein YjbJ (UPF0337 family)
MNLMQWTSADDLRCRAKYCSICFASASSADNTARAKVRSPVTGGIGTVNIMDKNRTEGAKHQVKGSVKEAAGKLTDNESKELHGKIEKNAGKVQRNVGEAADEIRDARRHHH